MMMPPLGWEFTFRALPKSLSSSSDVKAKVNEARNVDEEDDEGPPPGWEMVQPQRPQCMPQVQPSSDVSPERSQREVRTRIKRPSNVRQSASASAQQMPPPAPQPTGPPATSSASEHEVGQVTCKDCGMLLMYQYGASAVQCFTCHEVIEIGEHNRRGLPSAQPSQRRRHLNRRR